MLIKRMREGTMNVQGTYIRKLQNLHRDSIPGRWTDLTLNKAPHKPLLLLCISDLYRQDRERYVKPILCGTAGGSTLMQ